MASVQALKNLAIVGMDAEWAGCDSLEAFERMVYEGRASYGRTPGGISTQAACAAQLGRVVQRALRDAEIDPESSTQRVAILAAGGTPGSTTWPWAAQVVDLSPQANPLAAAVELAEQLLQAAQVDAVVFAACAVPLQAPAGAPLAGDSAGFGFDRDIHGWRFGEGAGAVVWMEPGAAQGRGRRIYAVIRAAAAVQVVGASEPFALPVPPALADVRACCTAALESAGLAPDRVGYIETFASGSDALDGIEIAGLAQAYRPAVQDLSTALGSVQTNTGYLGAASGLAGIVRAALCLYHRMIPGAPGWTAPKLPALWKNAPFYIPADSRAWFQDITGPERFAGLNAIGRGGSFAHLILSEPESQSSRPNRALAQGGFYLFPVVGASLDDLQRELSGFQQSLARTTDLKKLAAEYYEAVRDCEGGYAVAIVGHNAEEAAREIEMAMKALPAAFEKSVEWQTPLGSYFAPEPVGQLGGVALVYPGAFNSYPGVGKDLFRLFPELHQRGAEVTTHLGRVLRERMLYPRSLAALSKEELAAVEAGLLADPIAMLISGTALSILFTHILEDTFAIQPVAAFGYSLGENSMLYATGVWGQGDHASARLEDSEAFRTRLAGRQLAIREHWGLDPQQDGSEPLWSNYLVMAAPEKVQAALNGEPHVYMTHINTPRQVVIGGDPQACQRVLAEIRASSLKAPFDYALHCEVMRSEYGALAELHNWPVEKAPRLRMYSAADYGVMHYDQAEISQKIAHMLTSPLDFPRLVRQVYADGARVFIEAGAGSNCARWIDESLKGSPHLAISMDRRGTDDYSTLVRTVARLFCHRVPMDLSALYDTAPETGN